ncbi:alpha-ketoglutarate decarboxylase [Snuella lapsa]|uniref:Alpha-ketoglutarate decarboxylase n=1 Tax=Snuella lapsa TaxID=870481 RepID=A0ABP6XBC5_9FLAO
MGIFVLINKKFTYFFLVLFGLTFSLPAQQHTGSFVKHLRFGGGIGLSFGEGYFGGTLAPSAIYEYNNNLAFGIGLNGTINNQKDTYKSTIIGGSLIGLCTPFNSIQLSSEFEQLKVSRKYEAHLNIRNDSYWVPALFFGIGYRNGNATFGIRYDALYDSDKSIYLDPWTPFVRFYF